MPKHKKMPKHNRKPKPNCKPKHKPEHKQSLRLSILVSLSLRKIKKAALPLNVHVVHELETLLAAPEGLRGELDDGVERDAQVWYLLAGEI